MNRDTSGQRQDQEKARKTADNIAAHYAKSGKSFGDFAIRVTELKLPIIGAEINALWGKHCPKPPPVDVWGKPVERKARTRGEPSNTSFNPVASARLPLAKSTLRRLPMKVLLEQPDPFDFLEGILFERQLSMIYGPMSVGKSYYVIDKAMHVALGRKWLGREVAQRNVLYVALEGSTGIRKRVEAWCQHHERIDPLTVPFAAMDGALNLLAGDKETARDLRDFAREVNAGWIIIETFARTMPGGNEDSRDMGAVVGALLSLQRVTGAHVTTVHHAGKDLTKGSRGWSGVPQAMDMETVIRRTGNVSSAWLMKQRDGEQEILLRHYTLKRITLDRTDQRGKPITSKVIVPASAPEVETKLAASERAVVVTLDELGGNVLEGDLRAACVAGRAVSGSEKEKSRNDIFTRVYRELIDKKVIVFRGGRVFRSSGVLRG